MLSLSPGLAQRTPNNNNNNTVIFVVSLNVDYLFSDKFLEPTRLF